MWFCLKGNTTLFSLCAFICHYIQENVITLSYLPEEQPLLHPKTISTCPSSLLTLNYSNKTHYLSFSYLLCLAYKHCRESQFVSTWVLGICVTSKCFLFISGCHWLVTHLIRFDRTIFSSGKIFTSVKDFDRKPNLLRRADKSNFFLAVTRFASLRSQWLFFSLVCI